MADQKVTLAWWDKARPKTLPPTGFGKMLTTYEKTLKDFEKLVSQPKSDGAKVDQSYQAVRKAFAAVESGAKTTKGKCNKTLHKDAIKELDTFMSTTLKTESKRIVELYNHWSSNAKGMQKKDEALVQQIYDAREKIVQGLIKAQAAAKKEADRILDELNQLASEHQKILAAAKKGNKPNDAAVDRFKFPAHKAEADAVAWVKKFGPAIKAPWPHLDLKTVSDADRKRFLKQSDERENSLNVLNDSHKSVESSAKFFDKAVKDVLAAAK